MSWNGFPKHVRKSLINRLSNDSSNSPTQYEDNIPYIWFNVPYAGPKGEFLVKSLIRKLRRYLKKNTRIVVRYRNKNLGIHCSTKDRIPPEQRSSIIYEIKCPGCGGQYIGKTDRCLSIRLSEHGTRNDQPMFRHLSQCTDFIEYTKMFAINESPNYVSFESHILNAVLQNYSILD